MRSTYNARTPILHIVLTDRHATMTQTAVQNHIGELTTDSETKNTLKMLSTKNVYVNKPTTVLLDITQKSTPLCIFMIHGISTKMVNFNIHIYNKMVRQ